MQHAKMSKACLEIYGFPETEANAVSISRVVRNCRRGNRQQANETREDVHNDDDDDFFAASSREKERGKRESRAPPGGQGGGVVGRKYSRYKNQ
jgi:hypothetical protein